MPQLNVSDATKMRINATLGAMRLVNPAFTEDGLINLLLDTALRVEAPVEPPPLAESSVDRTPARRPRTSPDDTERARRGTSVPREIYKDIIIEILGDAGGRAPTREIKAAIKRRLRADGLLNAVQLDSVPSDSRDPRWWNHARFARQELVDQGVLAPSSQHGVWELESRPRGGSATAPRRTGRMTGAEAGLSGDEQLRICLSCFSNTQERLPMSALYPAVERRMGGATLSKQGKSSLRFFINKRGVEAGYFVAGVRGQAGWRATKAGLRFARSSD